MTRGGSRRISPSCRGYFGKLSRVLANSCARHSIWIAPSQLLRWMRPGWKLILCVRLAQATEPARGIHALLKCREPAIGAPVVEVAVIRAPRIVLGLGTRPNAE